MNPRPRHYEGCVSRGHLSLTSNKVVPKHTEAPPKRTERSAKDGANDIPIISARWDNGTPDAGDADFWEKFEQRHPRAPVPQSPERREKHRASNRRTKLKTAFGLTVAQYDAMLAAQDGVCAICHQACSAGRRLCVDHCHATGVNRGLLCRACNAALGLFRENPELLERAADYLRGVRGGTT